MQHVGNRGAPLSPGRRAEILAGMKIAIPACAAVLPLGIALGVLVVHSGLAWWWAPVIATVIFAGSMEFLLVGMLAVAAPLSQIALSTFLVNFRHVFYALSFPLQQVRGRGWRAYATFALTDEAYALTATPESSKWSQERIIAVQAFFQLAWVAAVTAGAGLGELVPPSVIGLDFAVTALFVVLAMEAYKARRSIPVAFVALLCGMVAAVLTPNNLLVVAMGSFVLILTASFIVSRRVRNV